MAKSASTVALEADPNDPEDFDVSEAGVEQALAERRSRRIGRPRGSTTSDRQQIALRVPRHVIDRFKAGGPGWQTRMVAALEREAASAGAGER